MKRKSLLFLILVASLCSCDANSSEDKKGVWKSFVATSDEVKNTSNIAITPFNTVMQLNYFLEDSNKENNDVLFNNVTSLYNSEVARLHKIFDRHNSYYDVDGKTLITNIKTINESYGTDKPVKCSDELYDLLKLSVSLYELTEGQFNIFTGTLTNYWDSIFNEVYNYTDFQTLDPFFVLDAKTKLESLVDSVPNSLEEVNAQLTFDDENKTVIFNKCEFNNDIKPLISVGGIAKGYATDIIKEKLIEHGYLNAYLISGGSSLSSVDNPIYTKENGGQKLSVVNPEKSSFFEKVPAFSFLIKEKFNFSTSGNYTEGKWYRFLDDNDNMIYRHHIINPFTGYSESYHRSVSIYTNSFSNAYVDAFTTAFMNLSIDDGLSLRNKILSQYPDSNIELLYLTQNGYEDKNNGIVAQYVVHATSSFDNTLSLNEGVDIVYES